MPTIIEKEGGGGNTVLAFILGAVLIAVAIVGFFMWDNYKSGGTHTPVVITEKAK